MSDEPLQQDWDSQLDDFIQSELPNLLEQLRTVSQNRGTKTVKATCPDCGKRHDVTVEVADMKDVRDTMALLTSIDLKQRQLAKGGVDPDAASKNARALLDDLREMSDEDLAELALKLEREDAPAE